MSRCLHLKINILTSFIILSKYHAARNQINCKELAISILFLNLDFFFFFLLTTGSKQPNIAPNISILPIFTLTGRAARCWPNGVSLGSFNRQAPIFLNRFIALPITCCCGGSNALERKSSGDPRLHFCGVNGNIFQYKSLL